jgi:hypothetical protein
MYDASCLPRAASGAHARGALARSTSKRSRSTRPWSTSSPPPPRCTRRCASRRWRRAQRRAMRQEEAPHAHRLLRCQPRLALSPPPQQALPAPRPRRRRLTGPPGDRVLNQVGPVSECGRLQAPVEVPLAALPVGEGPQASSPVRIPASLAKEAEQTPLGESEVMSAMRRTGSPYCRGGVFPWLSGARVGPVHRSARRHPASCGRGARGADGARRQGACAGEACGHAAGGCLGQAGVRAGHGSPAHPGGGSCVRRQPAGAAHAAGGRAAAHGQRQVRPAPLVSNKPRINQVLERDSHASGSSFQRGPGTARVLCLRERERAPALRPTHELAMPCRMSHAPGGAPPPPPPPTPLILCRWRRCVCAGWWTTCWRVWR